MQGMKDTKEFAGATHFCFTFVGIVNALFGAFTYMYDPRFFVPSHAETSSRFFAEKTADMSTENLSGSGFFEIAVKVMLCVDLFFTAPIILSAARQIVEAALFEDD